MIASISVIKEREIGTLRSGCLVYKDLKFRERRENGRIN